jgi:hypothetical protein
VIVSASRGGVYPHGFERSSGAFITGELPVRAERTRRPGDERVDKQARSRDRRLDLGLIRNAARDGRFAEPPGRVLVCRRRLCRSGAKRDEIRASQPFDPSANRTSDYFV